MLFILFEKFPSPKYQVYVVASDEVLVKETELPTQIVDGLAVKLAVGVVIITIVFCFV